MTNTGINQYKAAPGEIITFTVESVNFATLVIMDPQLQQQHASNFLTVGRFTMGTGAEAIGLILPYPVPPPAGASYNVTIASGAFIDGPFVVPPPTDLTQRDIVYTFSN